MGAQIERALIAVLLLVIVVVVGVGGWTLASKYLSVNDTGLYGDDTFQLCNSPRDTEQGVLGNDVKLLPIDSNTHTRQNDIYNLLPPNRQATSKSDLGAVLCIKDRMQNIDNKTYYKTTTGEAVAGCIRERQVVDLYIVDVKSRQTIAHQQIEGSAPGTCPSRLKQAMYQRGDPVSIDEMMRWISPEVAQRSASVAAQPTHSATAAANASVSSTTTDKIVFTEHISGKTQIFSIGSDGKNLQQLTNDPSNHYKPVWSPDGKQIAFHSDRSGSFNIYVMNADGSDVRRLTDSKRNDIAPAWSPDGKQIAFASDRGGSYDIFIVSAAGGDAQYITTWASDEVDPQWLPYGNQISFLSDHQKVFNVYTAKSDGSEVTQITKSNKNLSGAVWSSDGRKLAYAASTGIWTSNADGSNPQLIASTSGEGTDPSWSPDDSQLVYSSTVDGKHEIFIVALGEKSPHPLTTSDTNAWEPDWMSK